MDRRAPHAVEEHLAILTFHPARIWTFLLEVYFTLFNFIVDFKTKILLSEKKKEIKPDIFSCKSYCECPSVQYDISEMEAVFRAHRQAVDLGHTTSGWWIPAVVPFSANSVMRCNP